MSAHPESLLRIILFERPWQRWLILLLSAASAVAGLLAPFFQKTFVDSLLGESPHPWLSGWDPLVSLLMAFGLVVLYQFMTLVASYLGNKESLIAQDRLGSVLYDKMLSLRTDQLQARPTGEVVALFATDVPGATILLEQSLPMGFSILFPLILTPICLVSLFGIPVFYSVGVILSLTVINVLLARRQSRFFFLFKTLAAQRVGMINEWVQNMRGWRVLGWVPRLEDQIREKRVQETGNRVRMVTNGQVMNSISASVTFGINLLGLLALLALTPGPQSPGQIFALFWILAVFLTRPFRQMPWFFTFLMDGWSSLQRLNEFVHEHVTEPSDSKSSKSLSAGSTPNLEVQGLNLRLGGRDLLQNISFRAEAGQLICIAGEVGSGKTLLLLSLMGETGCSVERFRIDDEDILSLSTEKLKSFFAFAPQEGFVMSASVQQNVVFDYKDDSAASPRVAKCLDRAAFWKEVEKMEQGIATELGERGVNLSGGQRQRLTLARADYFDRAVLLLDDSLSALDVNTEEEVLARLIEGEWRNHTRILSTHRLSVLSRADRILFMHRGRIEAQGRLTELLRTSEAFREFVRSAHPANSAEVSA